MSKKEPKTLQCSFCDKKQTDVRYLIAGFMCYICDECVGVCVKIIDEEDKEKKKIKESDK